MKHEHHQNKSDSADPSKSSACCHHPKDDIQMTATPALDSEGVIYTCPMHLEIRQSSPGNCPNMRYGLRASNDRSKRCTQS